MKKTYNTEDCHIQSCRTLFWWCKVIWDAALLVVYIHLLQLETKTLSPTEHWHRKENISMSPMLCNNIHLTVGERLLSPPPRRLSPLHHCSSALQCVKSHTLVPLGSLHCTTLHCTPLHCTVMHLSVPCCTSLFWITCEVPSWTIMHNTQYTYLAWTTSCFPFSVWRHEHCAYSQLQKHIIEKYKVIVQKL